MCTWIGEKRHASRPSQRTHNDQVGISSHHTRNNAHEALDPFPLSVADHEADSKKRHDAQGT
jgi:hypothetical protein